MNARRTARRRLTPRPRRTALRTLAPTLAAAGALLVAAGAGPAHAEETKISVEEWHYLVKINIIGELQGKLFESFESPHAWNSDVAAYARDLSRFNAGKLRATEVPADALRDVHRQLVELIEMTSRYYGHVADQNHGQAKHLGKSLEMKFQNFQAAWLAIQDRYPEEDGG